MLPTGMGSVISENPMVLRTMIANMKSGIEFVRCVCIILFKFKTRQLPA